MSHLDDAVQFGTLAVPAAGAVGLAGLAATEFSRRAWPIFNTNYTAGKAFRRIGSPFRLTEPAKPYNPVPPRRRRLITDYIPVVRPAPGPPYRLTQGAIRGYIRSLRRYRYRRIRRQSHAGGYRPYRLRQFPRRRRNFRRY